MHDLNPFWYQNVGPGDPYFQYVAGLWHFDETAGSQTYIDSSQYANHMQGVGFGLGDTQTSATESVFGGASLRVGNGASNRAAAPHISAYTFNLNDFTIEKRFRADAVGTKNIFDMRDTVNGNRFDLYTLSTGELVVFINSTNVATSAAGVVTATTWHALAYDRVGVGSPPVYTGRLYCDGTVVASWADNTDYDDTTQPTVVVTSSLTAGYDSVYCDEMRITNGIARYQGAYTPAVAAFPNF